MFSRKAPQVCVPWGFPSLAGSWSRGTGRTACSDPCCYSALLFFPQNTLAADDHSSEDGFTLNPEDRREYPDLQAAHRPFPKQRFRQENGHTSLQRDGPRSFLLDLPNFPDLSKADINGQNPNIQVQIYVNVWGFFNELHKIILLNQENFQPGFHAMQSLAPRENEYNTHYIEYFTYVVSIIYSILFVLSECTDFLFFWISLWIVLIACTKTIFAIAILEHILFIDVKCIF